MPKSIAAAIARWYSIPAILLLWYVSVTAGWVTSRLLPSPVAVWRALVVDLENGQLIFHAGVTLSRAMTGFALAVVVGIGLAAAMARSALFARLFEPLFFFGYPVPKIALFPVLTFVFGIGSPSKIAFVFLECVYPIVVTTYFGIKGIQTRLIWTALNMGADRLTILRRVIIPAALPAIFAGLRIALPLSIVIVVVTEMIGDTKGLGYYLTIWSSRFRFTNFYAGMLVIGACGFVLDQTLAGIRTLLVRGTREETRR